MTTSKMDIKEELLFLGSKARRTSRSVLAQEPTKYQTNNLNLDLAVQSIYFFKSRIGKGARSGIQMNDTPGPGQYNPKEPKNYKFAYTK